MKKFHQFTKNDFDIAISWETRKIQTLFHLKAKGYTQHVKFTLGFANAEKITLAKQIQTPEQGGQNMIIT